jgi:hypothetical protein
MRALFQRFLGFDQLLGPALVRIVYYVAAAFIVIMIASTMFLGLMAIFAGNLGAGIMQMLAAPAVGAVVLVYWRFLCELFMLAFMAYERLVEIRDRLPDYSQF